ncbi:hypothetical protein [Streptomyces sp. NPDC007100]|uniref:hypothetical protein n=1 Tax=Streptomyces sp. NPDC007100 TaxID=3155602 RepID=UPI0033C481B0
MLAGALLLSLTGCSSDQPAPEKAQETPAPAILKSVDLHLPVETYLFSDAELEKLSRARAVLHKKCLKRFDLDYEIRPAGPPVGPRSLMDRRYGVTDKAEAEADGYHLGDRDPRTHPAHPPQLSDAQQEALTGRAQGKDATAADGDSAIRVNGVPVPPGGCSAEAAKELAGSGQLGPGDTPRKANLDSFTATKSDPRVQKAFKAWSGCMKSRGHSYPDPLTAISDPRFQGNSPTQQERETATADVACKKQVNLVGIWFTVETSLQKEMIARQQADFAAALKSKNEQLAKVNATLRDQ